MKKLLFTLAIYAIVVLITACSGNKSQEDHTGTHTHADGTVHEDGDHEEATKDQENFVVEADSSENHEHEHTHEEGEDHDHQH